MDYPGQLVFGFAADAETADEPKIILVMAYLRRRARSRRRHR